MARPASVVMSAADKKAAIKGLKVQIRELKNADKTQAKEMNSVVKGFTKAQNARAKELAALNSKLEKLSA